MPRCVALILVAFLVVVGCTATSTPDNQADVAPTGPTTTPTPTPVLILAPNSQRQTQTPVFYGRDGLTLEYYWPLDDRSNLSAEETEILAYNESDQAIEFTTPNMTFAENGSPRVLFSGTWEKFPSRDNWDRIEYISIPPSSYQGIPCSCSQEKKQKYIGIWKVLHPQTLTSRWCLTSRLREGHVLK